jgi:hypothetical protein
VKIGIREGCFASALHSGADQKEPPAFELFGVLNIRQDAAKERGADPASDSEDRRRNCEADQSNHQAVFDGGCAAAIDGEAVQIPRHM